MGQPDQKEHARASQSQLAPPTFRCAFIRVMNSEGTETAEAKEGRIRNRFEALEDEEAAVRKRLQSLTEMRAFHEKQMSLIERLPAGEVAWFLGSQRMRAATLIQSWWRRRRGRPRREQGDAAASEMSRTARQRNRATVRRFVEGPEREQLQAEIDRYRRKNPPPRLSEEQMRQTHSKIQQLFSEFYSRQQQTIDSSGKTTEDNSLFQRLEEDCRLLMEAPKLGELETEKEVHPSFFAPGSQTVATMAQKMHLKEMKAAGLQCHEQHT